MPRLLRQIICWAMLFQMANTASLADGSISLQASRQPIRYDSEPVRAWRVLKQVSTIQCPPESAEPDDPPTTSAIFDEKRFNAARYFKLDDSSRAEVRISWLGARFTRQFTNKIEPRSTVAKLRVFVLNRSSRSIGIAEEFRRTYELRLSDLWCLLKLQPGGEPGALLVDTQPNLFFVRNINGELNVVDALWSGNGWEIGASPMTNNRPWPARLRVIVH